MTLIVVLTMGIVSAGGSPDSRAPCVRQTSPGGVPPVGETHTGRPRCWVVYLCAAASCGAALGFEPLRASCELAVGAIWLSQRYHVCHDPHAVGVLAWGLGLLHVLWLGGMMLGDNVL